jgi:hypothetical protein
MALYVKIQPADWETFVRKYIAYYDYLDDIKEDILRELNALDADWGKDIGASKDFDPRRWRREVNHLQANY